MPRHFTQACGRKKVFANKAEAQARCHKACKAYMCQFCGMWHIATKRMHKASQR